MAREAGQCLASGRSGAVRLPCYFFPRGALGQARHRLANRPQRERSSRRVVTDVVQLPVARNARNLERRVGDGAAVFRLKCVVSASFDEMSELCEVILGYLTVLDFADVPRSRGHRLCSRSANILAWPSTFKMIRCHLPMDRSNCIQANARSLRRLHVTHIAVGATPASALHVHWRAGPRSTRQSAHPSNTNHRDSRSKDAIERARS